MPLNFIRADITKMRCDAIVNAANPSLLGGGGVDGAIHRAAGGGLLEECRTLGGCKTGEAKLTKGYGLPSGFVIHTVGPIWEGGTNGEEELLRSCYRNSLAIAKERGFESVAFPLISSGAYGYPKDRALKVAVDEITAFLKDSDMLVYLVIYDGKSFRIGEKLFNDITAYIDDRYVDERSGFDRRDRKREGLRLCKNRPFPALESEDLNEAASVLCDMGAAAAPAPAANAAPAPKTSLDDYLKQIDESFSEMLLRKIDEKGMT
ncbi:MAG: O-acetyl-ADP-ribose deacetylase, partial [Clostridia bacterium]|nr:O-acetyl-ADP-ribose deacetylase [Clostridia bacterium]